MKKKTYTRGEAAKILKVFPQLLKYYELKGELRPGEVRVGKRKLIVYTEKTLKKARKILRRNRKKQVPWKRESLSRE